MFAEQPRLVPGQWPDMTGKADEMRRLADICRRQAVSSGVEARLELLRMASEYEQKAGEAERLSVFG